MADRITDLLTKRDFDPTDFSQAVLGMRARGVRGGQGKTFGEAMNEIRAQKIKEATTLEDIMSRRKQLSQSDKRLEQADRQLGQADERIALAEKEFDLSEKKFKFESGQADQEAFESAFKDWSKDLSKQDMANLYMYARDHEEPVTAKNANDILSEGITALGLKKPPELEFKKPGSAVYKDGKFAGYVPLQKGAMSEEATAALQTRAGKINDMMRLYGMSRQEAADYVDGRIVTVTDQSSGLSSVVNKRTKEVIPLDSLKGRKFTDAERDKEEVRQTKLFEMVPDAVGGVNLGKAAISKTVGQMNAGAVSGKTVLARQQLKLTREKLLEAYRSSGRPAVSEQARIIDLWPSTGLFESEEGANLTLWSMQNEARRNAERYRRDAEDPSVPVKERQKLLSAARALDAIADDIGAPPLVLPGPEEQKFIAENPPGTVFLGQDGRIHQTPAAPQ